MRAMIKVNKLPDAPEPTRAVRVEAPPPSGLSLTALQDPKMKLGSAPPRPDAKRREWTQEEIDLMLEMHEHGMKNAAIARKLNRSEGNVCMRLQQALYGKKRKWIPRKERGK